MKKLNLHATRVFLELISRIKDQHVRLESDGHLPLILRRLYQLGGGVPQPVLYSLSHLNNQDDEPMRDPEMCFLVWDLRSKPSDSIKFVTIRPAIYQNDVVGIIEFSTCFEPWGVEDYDWDLVHKHCLLANTWLDNIRQQGFL